jgi:hypothetical protein
MPTEQTMDDALSASFPASDPPSWTSGVARLVRADRAGAGSTSRPAPIRAATNGLDARTPGSSSAGMGGTDPGRWTFVRALGSAAALVGLVLLTPLFVVALPAALALRLVFAIAGWPGRWRVAP